MNAVNLILLNGANSSTIAQSGANLRLENLSNLNTIQMRTRNGSGIVSQMYYVGMEMKLY